VALVSVMILHSTSIQDWELFPLCTPRWKPSWSVVRCWGFNWCFFLIMQDVSIMTIIWEVLVWPITPYLCPKLAASSDWLCGVGDALVGLINYSWNLPCYSQVSGLLLLDACAAPHGCSACSSLIQLDLVMKPCLLWWWVGVGCVIESVELLWMFWACCDELKCVYVLCWWFYAQTRISDVHISYLYCPHSLEVLTTHRPCMHE
jgi:hypothetical protein